MSALTRLIDALQVLPGVGPKSAQRMALHMLQRDRDGGVRLSGSLAEAMATVRHCTRCRNFAEDDLCSICASPDRNEAILCVVESPADILAIEHAGGFDGYYYVLHGRLSPLDGVGPSELGLDKLLDQVRQAPPQEVIVATNPTVEGEATAHYVAELLCEHVQNISRIAHGVPLGGELEYSDGGTIVHALQGRRSIS